MRLVNIGKRMPIVAVNLDCLCFAPSDNSDKIRINQERKLTTDGIYPLRLRRMWRTDFADSF
jgi:hypothetical protein